MSDAEWCFGALNQDKREKLEAAGYAVGDADEFLEAEVERLREGRSQARDRSAENLRRMTELYVDNERLRKLLGGTPSESKLRLLADYMDLLDRKRGYAGLPEVQIDLRRWADNAAKARAALEGGHE
jgi:hypothetical protein